MTGRSGEEVDHLALNDQTLRLRFTKGLDTEADEKTLPPGTLTRLENGVFTEHTSIVKRLGHEALTRDFTAQNSTITGGLDVMSDGDILYRDDGRGNIWSYGDATTWRYIGPFRSPTVNTSQLAKGPVERWNGDMAVASGLQVVAWEQVDGVYATVLDALDGSPLYGPDLLSAGSTKPRVVVCGTQFHIYMHNGTQIACARFNPFDQYTSWGAISAIAITADLDSRPALSYDVVPYNDTVVLAYPSTVPDVKLAYVGQIGVIVSSLSDVSRPDPVTCSLGNIIAGPALAISAQGWAHVVVVTGSSLHRSVKDATTFAHRNTGSLVTLADAGLDIVTRIGLECESVRRPGSSSPSDCRAIVFYEMTSSAGSRIRAVGKDASSSASLPDRHVAHRAMIIARPYATDDDLTYCPVMSTEPTQQTAFMVDYDGVPYAKLMPGLASPVYSGTLAGWSTMVDGRKASVFGRRDRVPTTMNAVGVPTDEAFSDRGLALATADWNASASIDWESRDGYVVVGGGQVHLLDGASVTELGFHLYPEGMTLTPTSASDGSTMGLGTYIYDLAYEWFDRYGRVHRSTGIQLSCSLTASAGNFQQNKVVISAPTPQFSAKGLTYIRNDANESVRLALWRSAAGQSTLHRADSPLRPIILNRSASFHTHYDNTTDAVLLTRQVDLRTVEVEDISPPAARHVALVSGRWMLSGIEGTPLDVWYSKIGDSNTGPSFSDSRVFTVPSEGGPVTGLAQLDDKGVIFKRTRIMAFNGAGPEDLEDDNSIFSQPVAINSDVGCTDSRTIVLVHGDKAQGLMFKSRKGFRLLDRGLTVVDVGAPVRDYDGLRVSAATREVDSNRVRFLTQDGLCLVYDTRWDQWSTFTSVQGNGSAIWQDRYVYVQSDGVCMVQTTGSHYKDGLRPYPMLIETGWIPFVGLQDYGRVRSMHILGDYYSPHILKVDVAYDYREGFNERRRIDTRTALKHAYTYGSGSYGEGGYGGPSADTVYQFDIAFRRQRCSAVRLRFSDEMDQDGGASFELTEVAITVALDTGSTRLMGGKRSK